MIRRLLKFSIYLTLVCFPVLSAGQNGTDLEVKVAAPASVHGGEIFSYSLKVTNIGLGNARGVYLINTEFRTGLFTSVSPSRGECEIDHKNFNTETFRCELGDLGPGAGVTVTVQSKLFEFDEDQSPINLESPFRNAIDGEEPKANRGAEKAERIHSRVTVLVRGTEESNEVNNSVSVSSLLFPSRNLAPRVKVLSPASEATIVRRSKSPFTMRLTIEADDPDGSVENVYVQDSFYKIKPVAGGEAAFLYAGKKYSAEQIDEISKSQPFGGLAKKVGDGIYAFETSNVDYGINHFHIRAVDNGGRETTSIFSFVVKSDADVKITSPRQNEVVKPGSDLVIEATSIIREGPVGKVAVYFDSLDRIENQEMTLVSRRGRVYRHRFVFKNIAHRNHAFANVRVILTERSGGITESESVSFLIRERNNVHLASPVAGNVYSVKSPVPIKFESDDLQSRYRVLVNRELVTEAYGENKEYLWRPTDPGKYAIQIVQVFSGIELSRSQVVDIVVK